VVIDATKLREPSPVQMSGSIFSFVWFRIHCPIPKAYATRKSSISYHWLRQRGRSLVFSCSLSLPLSLPPTPPLPIAHAFLHELSHRPVSSEYKICAFIVKGGGGLFKVSVNFGFVMLRCCVLVMFQCPIVILQRAYRSDTVLLLSSHQCPSDIIP